MCQECVTFRSACISFIVFSLFYRVFLKIRFSFNCITTQQTSLYLVSLSSVVLGECAVPGGNVIKQQWSRWRTDEQRVLLVKRFYQTASVITVQQVFRVKFGCGKSPSRSAINRLVTRSVIDNKKGVVGKKKSVRTPETFAVFGRRWRRVPENL
jgi:hypothetical protein